MSNKIGETSYKETVFGIIPRSKLIPLEIEGIKRAWDFILKKSKKGKISITPEFIKEIHKIGFAWIFPETGGKYRKIEVNVSKHTPPKYFLIPQWISDYTKDIAARMKYLPKIDNPKFFNELISLIAWAHHRFLWIHPFTDYNGRIARLLNNVILVNLNLPPIELRVETKARRIKYVQALQKADNGYYSALEEIIQNAIEESIQEIK